MVLFIVLEILFYTLSAIEVNIENCFISSSLQCNAYICNHVVNIFFRFLLKKPGNPATHKLNDEDK